MLYEIVDAIHILGLQTFDDYSRLNPSEITIDSNKIIETLTNKNSLSKVYYLVQIGKNNTDVIL